MLVHDDWQTLDLAAIRHRLTVVERNELRCRRAAVVFARAAEQHPDHPLYAPLTRTLVDWADEQAQGIRYLDQRHPGNRADAAFYPPRNGRQASTGANPRAGGPAARPPRLDEPRGDRP
jgi:hypothetical protein